MQRDSGGLLRVLAHSRHSVRMRITQHACMHVLISIYAWCSEGSPFSSLVVPRAGAAAACETPPDRHKCKCPVNSSRILWPHLCLRVRERRLRRQVPSNSLHVTPAAMPGHRCETDAAERRPAQASRARRVGVSGNRHPAHTSAQAAQRQLGRRYGADHAHARTVPTIELLEWAGTWEALPQRA